VSDTPENSFKTSVRFAIQRTKNLSAELSFLTRHPDSSFAGAKFISFAPFVNRLFLPVCFRRAVARSTLYQPTKPMQEIS
jgi:hypothetical protein